MTGISPNTFDALSRYVGVRLQQGVPLVDADWNELEDMRRFELRAYLKWFVGDGVPDGSDAFRIETNGLADDFAIRSGVAGAPAPAPDGLRNTGRCLVDGLDVPIWTDTTFKGQPLHTDHLASADAEATLTGGAKVDALPNVTGPVTVYLDVWERMVTPSEDPTLILPGLGTESCVRTKREWAVRTRAGTTAPVLGETAFVPGHAYTRLARIERTGAGVVTAAQITDLRQRRLSMVPSTLVEDTLGVTPAAYRRGEQRTVMPLRDALNALLRGDLPGGADTALLPAPGIDQIRRAFRLLPDGALVGAWASARFGPGTQVVGTKIDTANPSGVLSAVALTNAAGGAGTRDEPDMAVLPDGKVILAYSFDNAGNREVKFKQDVWGGLLGAGENDVAASATPERAPVVRVAGTSAVFLYVEEGATRRWMYRTKQWSAGPTIWGGAAQPLDTSGAAASTRNDLHAAVDPAGDVWAAFGSAADEIKVVQVHPSAASPNPPQVFNTGEATRARPFVVCAGDGSVYVFWETATTIRWAVKPSGGAWSATRVLTTNSTAGQLARPAAAEASDGALWVFWAVGPSGDRDIEFCRLDPVTGAGQIRRLTSAPGDDDSVFALAEPPGVLWTFWLSTRGGGDPDLRYRRMVTKV